MYRIELTPKAEEELVALGKSGDKASAKKVYRLFEELKSHPYVGTGKPEALVVIILVIGQDISIEKTV